ncbi:hypothetical protein AGMMS49938_17100 [Fibrobacterales bacterium]|nr:hypothetical protein AGMMS49938_17100 [Fibrobacterales bacterium]
MDLVEKTSNANRHPWELSRAESILSVMAKDISHSAKFVDIGAGDRFFTQKLGSIVKGDIYAVDSGYNENSMIDGIHCLTSVSDLPKIDENSVDIMGRERSIVTILDVLEHTEDAVQFLQEIISKVPQNTTFFITVPAFQFLFSAHDTFLKHFRRYNKTALLKVLKENNLKVKKYHYFYCSLFFARLFSRIIANKPKEQEGIGGWKFGEKHFITLLIKLILNLDFKCCAFLANLKIFIPGLSLLAVCERESN